MRDRDAKNGAALSSAARARTAAGSARAAQARAAKARRIWADLFEVALLGTQDASNNIHALVRGFAGVFPSVSHAR